MLCKSPTFIVCKFKTMNYTRVNIVRNVYIELARYNRSFTKITFSGNTIEYKCEK